ncbi:MAG: sigma 54-interacting transcriptional regulator [Cyclobacteriaceae bacterium]|nr:sigma 54-interacting transcriptional regulator [Cyclobacteriaceae bacterium]
MKTQSTPTEIDRLTRTIFEHTSTKSGKAYFQELVKQLSSALEVKGAWVTELLAEENKLRSFAFWLEDHFVESYEYDLINTPCEQVVVNQECLLISDKVVELFPNDPDLAPLNAVSYMGYPLLDESKSVIGHLAIIHDKPLHPRRVQEAVFSLFAERANAELIRLKAFESIDENRKKLALLIAQLPDALLELDEYGFISLVNQACIDLFGLAENELQGKLVFSLFDEDSAHNLREILTSMRNHPRHSLKNPQKQELGIITGRGHIIPVEASFSHYDIGGAKYQTLILRNMKDLRIAEERLKIIESDKLPSAKNQGSAIIGTCKVVKQLMEDLDEISKSQATVLLLGESGTGKEVFARYIHAQSSRAHKPLITTNCAAIPANLIESEFFGHEKGAFTGATARKEGRFALADGGTLFLDEIGELPVDLQPKLLRVLQEGEFESIGSTRTIKVDVRIIAATNRNLWEMVQNGTFREDLYFRLYVIPVHLPPLRERGDDVISIAHLFIEKYAKSFNKAIHMLTEEEENILRNYPWPGNIRELQHVIERAVLLSKNGKLNLHRYLALQHEAAIPIIANTESRTDAKIFTWTEWESLEKQNILKALEKSQWKISGDDGAAAILGLAPSTLSSKMKAFGLVKPRV